MDAQRVSIALEKGYAESGKRMSNVTGKNASLREYLKYDCNVVEEDMKNLAIFVFKSTPSVRGSTNDVVWTKALCDAPIEYVVHLAKTYHGFAEEIRKRRYIAKKSLRIGHLIHIFFFLLTARRLEK